MYIATMQYMSVHNSSNSSSVWSAPAAVKTRAPAADMCAPTTVVRQQTHNNNNNNINSNDDDDVQSTTDNNGNNNNTLGGGGRRPYFATYTCESTPTTHNACLQGNGDTTENAGYDEECCGVYYVISPTVASTTGLRPH